MTIKTRFASTLAGYTWGGGFLATVTVLATLTGCGTSSGDTAQTPAGSSPASANSNVSAGTQLGNGTWTGTERVVSRAVSISGLVAVGVRAVEKDPLYLATFDTTSGKPGWRQALPLPDPKATIDDNMSGQVVKGGTKSSWVSLSAAYAKDVAVVVANYAVSIDASGLAPASFGYYAAAFDAKTGTLMWQHAVIGKMIAVNDTPLENSPPLRVFVENKGFKSFETIDVSTGMSVFKGAYKGDVDKDAVVGKMLIGSQGGSVAAEDVTSGAILWRTPAEQSGTSISTSTLAIGHGIVATQVRVGSALTYSVSLLNAATGAPIGVALPSTTPKVTLDQTNNVAYVLDIEKSLTALDTGSGATVWTIPVARQATNAGQELFAAGNGSVWVLAAGTVRLDATTGKDITDTSFGPELVVPHQGFSTNNNVLQAESLP